MRVLEWHGLVMAHNVEQPFILSTAAASSDMRGLGSSGDLDRRSGGSTLRKTYEAEGPKNLRQSLRDWN